MSTTTRTTDVSAESYRRPRMIALGVGLVALVLGVVGLLIGGEQGTARFFQSYLFSYLFWLGLSLGSLAILLLHFLTGSRWGLSVRRIMEAGSLTVLLMAVLFIPILLALPALFPWARPGFMETSELLENKVPYLNVPFFIVRAVIYFVIWAGLAFLVNRMAARLADDPLDLRLRGRLQGWGAFGLILYMLTVTFSSVDWMMSISPLWNSTIFGMVTVLGQTLSALAFAILALNLFPDLGLGRHWTFETTPIPYKDLGAMLLTMVMGWAYLAYFQLLIIWAGNIPREVTWYLDRSAGGWQWVGILITVFQLALPFLLLLSIRARHSLRVLALLGGLIFVTYLVNLFWQIIPSYSPGVLTVHWLDLVLPLAIGGLWVAAFLFFLPRRPALTAEEQVLLETTPHKAIP